MGVLTRRRAAAPPPSRAASRSRLRAVTFGVLVLLYAVLTVGVVVYPSPVLDLDTWWLNRHLWGNHPQYHWFVNHYVILGQRGPATLVFLPVFVWVAWRSRTTRPLVLLATSLVLLNVSVAAVKYSIGRIGPRHADDVHQIFAGGTLFPSGHVSNAVVLYGLLAWILPRWRKWLIAVSVFICATVGLGTIYLRTHWFSDVVGGWIAGGLVLLALPTVLPTAQRWTDRLIDAIRARRARRRDAASGSGGSGGGLPRRLPGIRRPEPIGAGPGRGQGNATPVS